MGLSNTNKLIRFYNGANGMKTGFTSSALYCLSATAKRGKMQLIATVMKGPTSDRRFQDAKKLLDYGFANYSIYEPDTSDINSLPVSGGIKDSVKIGCRTNDLLIAKGRENKVEQAAVLEEKLYAPVKKGQSVGYISYSIDGEEIARVPVIALESVRRMRFGDIFTRMFEKSVSIR